jgi:hypothetical protein
VDFPVLDRSVASKGDQVLQPLREALENIHHLTTWWIKSATEGVERSTHDVDRPWGSQPNLIASKTLVVSLRAVSDKLASGIQVEKRYAVDAAGLLEQGVVEQLLSWSSEANISYAVLHQAFRHAPAPAPALVARTPTKHKGQGTVGRRRQSMLLEKLASRRQAEQRATDAMSCGDDDCQPVFRASMQRLCAAVSADSESRNTHKRARMQAFRPPRLVIPETSWDFKCRKNPR